MTLILSGLLVVLCFDGSRRKRAVRGMIIACLAPVGLAGIWSGIFKTDYPAKRSQLPSEVRDLPDGMRALVSFPTVWPLQVEYGQAGLSGQSVPFRLPRDMTELESVLFESVVDDLIRKKPELILVSGGPDPVFNNAHFDYVAYFSQNEALKSEMALYELGPRLGHVRF